MPISSESTSTLTLADRCFKVGRFIHWMTVALLSGLLVTALLWNIDSHGSGNTAFLWHSSLGISVYLLSMARVLLWLVDRPTRRGVDERAAQGERRGASESYDQTRKDTTYVIRLNRVHAALAAALSAVIFIHIFTIAAQISTDSECANTVRP
jgi:cytochrome b561